MKERWKNIEDYPMYRISDHGNVMSFQKKTMRMLKPVPANKTGVNNKERYLYVRLYGENGPYSDKDGRTFLHVPIQILVAQAFVPGRAEGLQVTHKDNDTYNNHYSNLEWATHLAIVLKSNLTTRAKGETHHYSKLTDDKVRGIIKEYKLGLGRVLALKYNISDDVVRAIARGLAWKHIPRE